MARERYIHVIGSGAGGGGLASRTATSDRNRRQGPSILPSPPCPIARATPVQLLLISDKTVSDWQDQHCISCLRSSDGPSIGATTSHVLSPDTSAPDVCVTIPNKAIATKTPIKQASIRPNRSLTWAVLVLLIHNEMLITSTRIVGSNFQSNQQKAEFPDFTIRSTSSYALSDLLSIQAVQGDR